MHVGWISPPKRYEGGCFTNGAIELTAFRRILPEAGEIDRGVYCKVNHPRRYLIGIAPFIAILEKCGASFVSMRRRTIYIPLEWTRLEREIVA